jgi:membrane-associated phospholipid phosphatase
VKVHWFNPAAVVADPLAKLDDADPRVRTSVLAPLVPATFSPSRVVNDFAGAGVAAAKLDWLRAGAIGAGAVLTSSLLDDRAHRFAQERADSGWMKNAVRAGNAIPWAGFAAAGALALDGSDPRRSRTGYASVEAGATAFVLATGLKYAVGRARPSSGLGNRKFNWLTSDDAHASFPSRHAMAAWGLATPFALEYDMPWLYGVAAVTNLARIGSREHWVSDTVASSVLGYGIGRLFWQSSREQAKGDPRVYFDGSSLGMSWDW